VTGQRPLVDSMANGIPFAVLHRPGADVTTVSVWILSGSRHEPTPGVAHLMEHLLMQAVPRDHNQRVVDAIEGWGGDANAMTTRDHVVLYARVPSGDAGQALSVLCDATTMAVLDDEVFEGERRVVQEELRLAASDPTDIVHDVFFSTAFGEHPFGRPVGGTLDGIGRITRDDLTAWTDANVRAELLAVVASGGADPDLVRTALAGSSLATLPAASRGRPAEATPTLTPGRRDLALTSDTVSVVCGGRGFAITDRRMAAAEVVMELLAGGNASVLVEEIRSRRGLSYDLFGGASGYRDGGSWRITISTAPENRDEVVDTAVKLVQDATDRGFTADEVRVAGRRVAGLLRLETEPSLEDALRFGDHAFVGGGTDWSVPAYVSILESLTTDEVNACARHMVDQLVIATAGPNED
jgi:predicted Zn-dependent peptidase